jgi:hypothetical protein
VAKSGRAAGRGVALPMVAVKVVLPIELSTKIPPVVGNVFPLVNPVSVTGPIAVVPSYDAKAELELMVAIKIARVLELLLASNLAFSMAGTISSSAFDVIVSVPTPDILMVRGTGFKE